MSDLKIEAPIELQMRIMVTDGERQGWVTYDMPVGRYPTQKDIDEGIEKAIQSTREQMGEDWNIPNPQEFMESLFEERYGQKVAVPYLKEYSEPYSANEDDEEDS